MAADFEIRGADEFLRVSKALKAAGQTELRKELNKAMRDGARPLVPIAKQSARSQLPTRGGLAAQVAGEPIRVQVRTGAQTAGVRIVVGRRKGGSRGANRGVIRHPVFGNREVWVNQPVDPGWFDEAMQKAAPEVRPDLERALERVAKEVAQRG